MYGPREVLNELRWRHRALAEARIEFIHRGAPGDVRIVHGGDVVEVGSWAFVLQDRDRETTIPYHRVQRVWRGETLVWRRDAPAP